MSNSKKYKGSGRKVSDTTFLGMPAVLYRIEYDRVITVRAGEMVEEVQKYNFDGSVTVEGEVVKADE